MAQSPAGNRITLPSGGIGREDTLALATHWAVMPDSPIDLPLAKLDQLSPTVPVQELFATCTRIASSDYASVEHAAVSLAETIRSLDAYRQFPDELRRWTAVAARLALRQAAASPQAAAGARILFQSVFWDFMGSARIGLTGWQSHQAEWHSVVPLTAMFLRHDRPMELSPGINDGEYYCATFRSPQGEESYHVHFDRLGMTALTTGASRALTRHEIAHGLMTSGAVDELQKLMPGYQPRQLSAMMNAYEDIRVNVLFPEPGLADLYRGIIAALKVNRQAQSPENELWGLSLVRAMKLPLGFSASQETEEIWKKNQDVILSLSDQRTLPIHLDGAGITLNSYRERLERCNQEAARVHHHILHIFSPPPAGTGGGNGTELAPGQGAPGQGTPGGGTGSGAPGQGTPAQASPGRPGHGPALPLPLIGGRMPKVVPADKLGQDAQKLCEDLILGRGKILKFRGARETALSDLLSTHRRILAHGIRQYDRMLKDELARVRETEPSQEGEELSVPQFLVKRRIDPREARLWLNHPQRRRASKFTIDLVCDVSGSVYSGRKIIRPAVEMLALSAMALEQAGHRTSLSLFANTAEILYHGSDPLPRKREVLSLAIESARLGNNKRVQRGEIGGGTEALYCLGALAKNLESDKTPSPGPRIGLIFTDGNLDNSREPRTLRLKETLAAHIPLICVCFPQVFATAVDLFGKGNTIGVPELNLRAVDAIRKCIIENVERLGLMRTPEENVRVTREINQVRNNPQVRKLKASVWQK